MASGKQVATENVAKFEAWVQERRAAGDWNDYVRGSQLNRTEIARECGFAKSVLRQNPTVKTALEALEKELRDSGALGRPNIDHTPQTSSEGAKVAIDKRIIKINDKTEKRVKALEEQNAALKAEVAELRAKIKRYELIEKHLAETGRVVRP